MSAPGPFRFPARFAATTLFFCLGCASHSTADKGACFGAQPILVVDAGRIGALRLDLPLDSLRLACPGARDTIVSAFEARDTAVVIHDAGLVAIAHFATVEASDDGDRRPVSFHGRSVPTMWDVSGSRAVLPGGVRLNATWREARDAWGAFMDTMLLNGIRMVTICDDPELRIFIEAFDDPNASNASRDSSKLAQRIAFARIPSRAPSDARRVCP